MKRGWAAALAAGLLFLGSSCASTQLAFLDRSLADADKAELLVEAGIGAYNARLVQDGDLSQLEPVKAYFVNALRFDPANAEARRYLDLVSGFKALRLQSLLKEAQALSKKQARSEEETFRLCVLLAKAAEIDGRDGELARLEKASAAERSAFVESSLAKAKAALERAAKAPEGSDREGAAIAAFEAASRAASADPSSARARSLLDRARPGVRAIALSRLDSVPALVAKGSFSKAKANIDEAEGLSARLGGALDSQAKKASYELYCAWAQYYCDKKDYDQADAKAAAALAAQSGASAQALRQKIAALKDKAEEGSSFEEGLVIADGLIKRGALAQASRSIKALEAKASAKDRGEELEELRGRLKAALADRYAKGVAAYQAEKFDLAIAALGEVVSVDPAYQQAADYLDKARAKQQVLLAN